jgi:hypothetical protein
MNRVDADRHAISANRNRSQRQEQQASEKNDGACSVLHFPPRLLKATNCVALAKSRLSINSDAALTEKECRHRSLDVVQVRFLHRSRVEHLNPDSGRKWRRKVQDQERSHKQAKSETMSVASFSLGPEKPAVILPLTYEVFEGSSLRSRFPMAQGWCSPALPTSVYDRSNPFGPSTFISQSSFARDPTIETCHWPGRPLRTCSTTA